jgi:hypothetical protein
LRLRLLLHTAGRESADDAQDLRVHTLGALRVSRGALVSRARAPPARRSCWPPCWLDWCLPSRRLAGEGQDRCRGCDTWHGGKVAWTAEDFSRELVSDPWP